MTQLMLWKKSWLSPPIDPRVLLWLLQLETYRERSGDHHVREIPKTAIVCAMATA